LDGLTRRWTKKGCLSHFFNNTIALINWAMQVRALSGPDAEAFRALRREALIDSPHAFSESVAEHDAVAPAAYAARMAALNQNQFIVAAFDDSGKIIGSVGFSRNIGEKSRHKGIIWGVYVKPEARGSGAAKAMMLEVIRRAKAIDGLEQIKLGVRTGQNAARNLYLSLGFEPWGLEQRSIKVNGEYIDEDLMVLRLNP
jgi:RimJ/RimL family protein N-acetyltransferase